MQCSTFCSYRIPECKYFSIFLFWHFLVATVLLEKFLSYPIVSLKYTVCPWLCEMCHWAPLPTFSTLFDANMLLVLMAWWACLFTGDFFFFFFALAVCSGNTVHEAVCLTETERLNMKEKEDEMELQRFFGEALTVIHSPHTSVSG